MIPIRTIIILCMALIAGDAVSQRTIKKDPVTMYIRPSDIIDQEFFSKIDSVIDLTPYRYHKYVKLDFLPEESVDQYADSLRNKYIDFEKPMYVAFWTYTRSTTFGAENNYMLTKTKKRTYFVPDIAQDVLIKGRKYLSKHVYDRFEIFSDLANTSRVRIIFKDGNKMKLLRMQNSYFMFLHE